MNAILKFLNKFFSPNEPLKADEIEAYCPKCGVMQDHKITGDIYSCTVCGNKQKSDEALTRQDTSW